MRVEEELAKLRAENAELRQQVQDLTEALQELEAALKTAEQGVKEREKKKDKTPAWVKPNKPKQAGEKKARQKRKADLS